MNVVKRPRAPSLLWIPRLCVSFRITVCRIVNAFITYIVPVVVHCSP